VRRALASLALLACTDGSALAPAAEAPVARDTAPAPADVTHAPPDVHVHPDATPDLGPDVESPADATPGLGPDVDLDVSTDVDSRADATSISPPAVPVVLGVAPPSPAKNHHVELHGLADPGTRVFVFRDADCRAPAGNTLTADDGTWLHDWHLVSDAVVSFHALAQGPTGLRSACSTTFVVYEKDGTPPAPPRLVATEPRPPASDTTPRVLGRAEPGATVTLHVGACEAPALATGTADTRGDFALAVAVVPGQITPLVARAADRAGNLSGCSDALGYVHAW